MSSPGTSLVSSSRITTNPQIGGWYSSDNAQSSSQTILKEAYENAKSIFETELTSDEKKKLFLDGKSSLEDVRKTLATAKAHYDTKKTSKARKWLSIFSSKVMFYASVLDVLVQQNPQYVALAWGAMRFLFGGVVNHEETARQLSKSFSQIADILPRTELSLILYPTETMKETVAHLYACMIRFIIHAVRWYKQGKFAHAWAAVANPWALSFKNHFDDLAEQAQRVEELARSASRAELRDTHLELRETREVMQKYFEQMKSENSQLIQMALANKSLATQIQVDVSESKTMIANIQLGQILSMSFTENLPASGECLRYCQSMLKRRRHGIMPLLPDTSQLKTWSVHPRSSFLITESSSGQAAKDFLVNLVDLIRTSNHLILWALRFAGYWERNLTGLDILRMLVIQSLQINPTALTSKTHPLTMSHFREAVNEEDWLNILNRALVSVPYVYIVLDADLLSYATGRDRYQATKLIEAFPNRVTSTVVKLIVSTAGVDERYFSSNWDPDCWSKLRTDRGAVGHDSRIQRRRARHRIQNRFSNPRNRWGG